MIISSCGGPGLGRYLVGIEDRGADIDRLEGVLGHRAPASGKFDLISPPVGITFM